MKLLKLTTLLLTGLALGGCVSKEVRMAQADLDGFVAELNEKYRDACLFDAFGEFPT